jgi:hypothetical protein
MNNIKVGFCIIIFALLFSCKADTGLVGSWLLFVKDAHGSDISNVDNNILKFKSNSTFSISFNIERGKVFKTGLYILSENGKKVELKVVKLNDPRYTNGEATVVGGEISPGTIFEIVTLQTDTLKLKQINSGEQLIYTRQ